MHHLKWSMIDLPKSMSTAKFGATPIKILVLKSPRRRSSQSKPSSGNDVEHRNRVDIPITCNDIVALY